MGLSLLGPGGSPELPVRTTVEIGPADIFVAVALIYVLSYLYLLEPIELQAPDRSPLRVTLVAATIPLISTFIGVVVFTSFELV